MKTFLFVTLYAAMVGALDVGGVVWTRLHTAPAPKAPAVFRATGAAPAQNR